MAFYEMLPGAGMPPGLQAGMDSVLNKKFGTSTTYPAEDWPDTVNLMGPLPEKTASGAIVTFSDGADGVPIKSWEVSLPASLDGYSEVDVVSAGVNLWDEEWEEGLISASDGQNTPSDQYSRTKNYITVKPSISVYLFLGVTWLYIRRYGKDKGYLGYAQINTSSVWNVPSDTYFIRFCWDGTTYTDNISVNYPSTETAYNSANNPTTHTASLGRTIYGGTADIVNGEGSIKTYKHTFTGDNLSSFSLSYGTTEEGYTHMYFYTNGTPLANNPSAINVVSDIGVPWNANASASPHPSNECYRIINTGSGANQHPTVYVYIHQTWASNDAFKAWLNANPITMVYEVSDTTDFTFAPITPTPETSLGTNNFWADEGDSEVTYRADINLALGGN